MMLQPPSRRVLLLFIFSLVSIQGLTLNLMPVLFRTLGRAFGLSLGQEGQIQSFFFLGAMLALFSSGWITEWLGVKKSGLAVVGLIGLGAILLGCSQNYAMAGVAATFIGIGNQWVLAVYSAVIAVQFREVRQKMFMWVLAMMAAMAACGPLILGYLLTQVVNWRLIFLALGILLWGIGALFYCLLGSQFDSVKPAHEAGKMSAQDLLTSPTLWLIGLLVILDNLASGNLNAWTPRLFQIRYSLNEAQAGLLLSANMAGMLTGRIVMGAFVTGKLSDRILLSTCYAIGMLVYSLLLLGPSYPVALGLMALQGVCLSAQAPSTYSLTTMKFPTRAAVAVPLVDAIGTMGGITGPALLGWSAERWGGLEQVIWSIPCVGSALAAISASWEFFDRWTGRLQKTKPLMPV
jgi:MFS family permease